MILHLLRARTTLVLRRILIRHPALLALVHNPVGRRLRQLIKGISPFEALQSGPDAPVKTYEQFRIDRIAECQQLYADVREPDLLCFITTVWNTDVEFLHALTESVLAQRGGIGFRWLILDNGSSDPNTIAFLKDLDCHDFIQLERVENNLGIIGGMRYCLERANGRYILPLDSDDYLYPQCVSILTEAIRRTGYPALLYSDEDKRQDKVFRDPYYKPDWDPVLFVNSCYIAHLCAIDREIALLLGAYSDGETEGSHDWDTFTRFLVAGHTPVHVREVLYSWRMHPQSTAGNFRSKPVIYNSQTAVLKRFLAAASSPDDFALLPSPLFDGTPDWWISRRPVKPRPMATVTLQGETVKTKCLADPVALAGLLARLEPMAEPGALVHLLGDRVEPLGKEWRWDTLGLFELFPDCVMVGGRIISQFQEVLAAGQYFGFGNGCDTPDRGRSSTDLGYFAQMLKHHSVSAVSSAHCVVDAVFLRDSVRSLVASGLPVSIAHLGAWCGVLARRRGKRVIYSPFIYGQTAQDWSSLVSEDEHNAFAHYAWDLMPDEELLSPHLGLDLSVAYRPVSRAIRENHLDGLAKRFGLPRHATIGPRRP